MEAERAGGEPVLPLPPPLLSLLPPPPLPLWQLLSHRMLIRLSR